MEPDTMSAANRGSLPPWPAPPVARPRPGTRWLAGAVAMVVLVSWTQALFTIGQERRAIDRLDAALAHANASVATLTTRVDELGSVQSSLAADVDGRFDPPSIIAGAQGSVFTLMAGPWQGSAFVISSGDHTSELVTNFHVVRTLWSHGVRRVVLRNQDASFNGTIVDVHPDVDLAFVEIDVSLPELVPIDRSLDVGEPIVVLGSPYGYGGTVSTGVVSAIRARYVQFSAPVSPGSSGGPVLDAFGRVIGVAAAKVQGPGAEGLSFAIPTRTVCRMTVAC